MSFFVYNKDTKHAREQIETYSNELISIIKKASV